MLGKPPNYNSNNYYLYGTQKAMSLLQLVRELNKINKLLYVTLLATLTQYILQVWKRGKIDFYTDDEE
jgi:hypothetical protein